MGQSQCMGQCMGQWDRFFCKIMQPLSLSGRGNVGYGLNTRVHITIPGPRPTVAVVAQAATVVAPALLLRGRESIRTWRSW
jgi:hypothetical protein